MHPDSMRPDTAIPQPYIAWFKVFEKEQTLLGDLLSPREIRLKPEENFFTIGFSALGFYNGQTYRFAYKLEGFDRDWVYPEPGVRFAGYTGIKGGDYVFRLKVATSPGVWNEAALQWHIHVGTPWWATWWFRLAVLAAVLTATYYWMKSRFRHQQTLLENQRLQLEREQTLRQERDRIAAEMHDELGAGLSTIRLLSLVAKSQETDAHQLKRIEKIAQNAADVMGKMAEIVWVMNSRNDSLESFAAYVCRYAGEYLDTHNIYLLFEMPDGKYILNSTQRRTILLAVKECLHNIVKHAGATEVKLYFVGNKRLKIIIADNGTGIPKEVLQRFQQRDPHLSGNGLYNLHQRMEKLGGKTTIENHHGTKITLDTGITLTG
jgi:signal transduction histidine kinase